MNNYFLIIVATLQVGATVVALTKGLYWTSSLYFVYALSNVILYKMEGA